MLPELSPSRVVYETEPPSVAQVLIRVDYSDGTAREWEAREPQDFHVEDQQMSVRRTGIGIAAGDTFAPVSAAVPAFSLRFTAHPRHNLRIRTRGPWRLLSDGAHSALAAFISAMGYD